MVIKIHPYELGMFFIIVYIHILEACIMVHTNIKGNFMDAWSCYFIINDGYAFMGYVLPWGQMSFWEPPL